MHKIYYYSCPIRAAYMAKEFGMMFGIKHNGKLVWDWIDMLNTPHPAKTAIDILEDYPDEPRGHLYVHPDSLHILEPKMGDGVEFDRWYWERKRKEKGFEDAPPSMHFGHVRTMKATRPDGGEWMQICSAGIGWDDNYSGEWSLPFIIIQRNNNPFFMPEVEICE